MNQDNEFFGTPFQKGDKKFFSSDSDLETLSDKADIFLRTKQSIQSTVYCSNQSSVSQVSCR